MKIPSARLVLVLCGVVALTANAETVVSSGSGGGPVPPVQGECVSLHQRAAMPRATGEIGVLTEPQPYPFQPIAGTVWQDRYTVNFVDQDATGGIRDWDCSALTYNGHRGHDIGLRGFFEQDTGVPVFAALDGTVAGLHDGEFDRNTTSDPSRPANYVVLDHGLGHRTLYYHLRQHSVAVSLNQAVKAGTQLGLAASSGNSTGPHLHFESQLSSVTYEPYAGACQTNTPSRWVSQTSLPRDTYLGLFALHTTNIVTPFLPDNPPRAGTVIRNGGAQVIGWWNLVHNLPANSAWRARFKRPDGTVFYDSNTQSYPGGNAYAWSEWWAFYTLALDVNGLWTIEFSVNGSVLVNAPFLVLAAGSTVTNRPPLTPAAAFDPPAPATSDVVFCRITPPWLEDPDYDFVRYRYRWKLNDTVIRDVTNGAWSDAVPRQVAQTGDRLSCTITPNDGITNGPPVTVATFVGGIVPIALSASALPGNGFRLTWTTSGPPYALEFSTNLSAVNWQTWSSGVTVSGAQNVVTNPGSGSARLFRLRLLP